MRDWDGDSDDFEPPPLFESVKLDDEFRKVSNDIRQHEEEYDSDCDLPKFPPPPVQNNSAPARSEEEEAFNNLEEEDSEDEDSEDELELGETPPPDMDLLTETLKPDEGKPRNLRAKCWICPDCAEPHEAVRNFIADTQAYKCNFCGMQNITSYNWSLTRVKLNGVSLDFSKVHLQKEKQCLVFAFLALCDMMRRVRGANCGWDEATPLDVESMLSFFALAAGWRMECSSRLSTVGRRQPHIEIMLQAAVMYGVPYSSVTLFDRYLVKMAGQKVSVPKRTLKVKSWFRVDREDVGTIVRLLAHGIPLLTVVPLGKCFGMLPNGEVYHAPKAGDCYAEEPKDACITHAVVIHGSSITVPECDLSEDGSIHCEGVYLKCRNCHGTNAHRSWEKKGDGADFNVWAADILTDVYGLNLYDFDD